VHHGFVDQAHFSAHAVRQTILVLIFAQRSVLRPGTNPGVARARRGELLQRE
jgi:hypothetical protein